jgi:hypothetical protein
MRIFHSVMKSSDVGSWFTKLPVARSGSTTTGSVPPIDQSYNAIASLRVSVSPNLERIIARSKFESLFIFQAKIVIPQTDRFDWAKIKTPRESSRGVTLCPDHFVPVMP